MEKGVLEKTVIVLLVEDNPGDARLAKEALREGKTESSVHVVDNCKAALQFLRNEGTYRNSPRPDIILLDLNLNGESGLEVLSQIKSDAELCSIPVVILTTSTHQRDIQESYKRGANCYINKRLELDDFIKVMRALDQFWFRTARLPT